MNSFCGRGGCKRVQRAGPCESHRTQHIHEDLINARTHLSDCVESHPITQLRPRGVTGKRISQIALRLQPQPHRHTTRWREAEHLRLLFSLNLNRSLLQLNGKSGHLPDCPCDPTLNHFITSQGEWEGKRRDLRQMATDPQDGPRAACVHCGTAQPARAIVVAPYKLHASSYERQ